MIKLIGFDLDDTLWDVAPIIRRAELILNGWLKTNVPQLKFDVESMRQLRTQVLQENPTLIHKITEFRRCIIELAICLSDTKQAAARSLSDEAMEIFLQARNQIELFDGAHDVLVTLSRQYTLAALTNGNADIKRLGLDHVFSFAFSAEQVGAPKPESHLFTAALQRVGIEPREMIYVGDDPRLDIDAAKKMGIHAIWMDRGTKSAEECQADAIITNISQLPAAVSVISQG